MQRQCENEKSSLLRERRGTPFCDQLDRIFNYQKKQLPAENTAPAPKQEAPEQFSEYRWNGMYQKHCFHDKNGNVSTCF